MQVPLELSTRRITLSPALEAELRKRATKLERHYDRITSCRIAVERPSNHHNEGGPYRVRLDSRGEVKTPAGPPQGRVVRLFPEDGFGFLEAPDGREVYFHRNSVLEGFDSLEVGSEVRFAEEQGIEGPQASTVSLVGKGD
jgi:cold shock CspA family protein